MIEGELGRRNGQEREWQIGPRIMARMGRMMSINNIRRFWRNLTDRIGSNYATFFQWIHARLMVELSQPNNLYEKKINSFDRI
jgi:hypothetical protein